MDYNNNITPRLDALDSRLSRIETKLDDHLSRVSSAESDVAETKRDIEWLRGYARISTTVFLAAVGGAATFLLRYLFPGK